MDATERGAAFEAAAATPAVAEGALAAAMAMAQTNRRLPDWPMAMATAGSSVAVTVTVAKEKVPKVLAAAFSTMVSHQVPCFVEGEGGGARVRVALRARVDTFAASRERHKEKVS